MLMRKMVDEEKGVPGTGTAGLDALFDRTETSGSSRGSPAGGECRVQGPKFRV